ncbi:MAG: DUF499 domain-containing protein [bacterium]|nr:DUF499 domain-containing protein [bacterium]MDE0600407.1 DUF499 domain-containing protein [bacterium]
MTDSPTPWWTIMSLRREVITSGGVISDVRMSLHSAALASGARPPYSRPDYYGEITHPAGSLVDFMARVAVRLGVPHSTQTPAVWRLDQAMGGGKSHGLVGLWHLATYPRLLADTDLGREVIKSALDITGRPVDPDLNSPLCVVLDCDNTTATEEDFGPAKTLGERFLWRLFQPDHNLYEKYRPHLTNKAKLGEALQTVGRPILVLIDEIMDYLRVMAASDYDQAVLDMGFIRAVLEAVNTTPNCAMVVAMIASDKDNMAMTEKGLQLRAEMEDLLTRHASTTAVTSGGDFADIIQKRLFANPPPGDVTDLVADLYTDAITPPWHNKVFKRLNHPGREEFRKRVARSYPFHPNLIALAEDEWATHAGFQKVRSTINVFALAVYEQTRRGQSGEWTPPLIDSGDLPLDHPPLRDALLNSGLVEDQKTSANLREVATIDITDPHNPDRGTAHQLDAARDQTWAWVARNPRAAERMATAMFVRSLNPRAGGERGATEAEILAASFVPITGYETGDAETVFGQLVQSDRGMVSIDSIPGQGRSVPKRWVFETRKTLEMLTRAEKASIPDADRDKAITDRAFAIAQRTRKPFDRVLLVEGPPVPAGGVTLEGSLQVLKEELVDNRETRLAILDSRWFSLFNGDDSATRDALEAGFGLGPRPLSTEWASSLVFACANTALRAQARGLAAEWLARKRVSELPSVVADSDMLEKAKEETRKAQQQLDRRVRLCYQHIVYLAPKGTHQRQVGYIRIKKDTSTALHAADVWNALNAEEKAFAAGQFNQQALMHMLRESDYGRPLREIRDIWWSNPHKPLLHDGEEELQHALYQAVTDGEVALVGDGGEPHKATRAADINLNLPTVRLLQPTLTQLACDTCGHPTDKCQCPEPPVCAACGQSKCECPPPPCSKCGKSQCQCSPPKKHWQVTFNITVSSGSEEGKADLAYLLRQLANRIEEGKVDHVNQMAQLIIGDQEDVHTLEQLAKDAGFTINIQEI